LDVLFSKLKGISTVLCAAHSPEREQALKPRLAACAQQIATAFRYQGLQLTGDAMKAVINVLQQEEDAAAALSSVNTAVKDRIDNELRTSVIDEATIAAVVVDLSNTADDLARDRLTVFSAFGGARIW
jgi:shikimate 5-dehydrogenase